MLYRGPRHSALFKILPQEQHGHYKAYCFRQYRRVPYSVRAEGKRQRHKAYALQHKSAAYRYGYGLLGPLKRGHESAYQHIEAQNYV